jgi:hypothetical protein
MDPKVEKMFRDYEKAFSTLNVKKNASYYSDTVISAGPEGSIVTLKEDLIKTADKTAEYYWSIGLTSARIKGMEEIEISAEYSLVKVHWEAKLTKRTKMGFNFDVSYVIQKNRDPPKIILFIAHQDQQEVLRLLGVK